MSDDQELASIQPEISVEGRYIVLLTNLVEARERRAKRRASDGLVRRERALRSAVAAACEGFRGQRSQEQTECQLGERVSSQAPHEEIGQGGHHRGSECGVMGV